MSEGYVYKIVGGLDDGRYVIVHSKSRYDIRVSTTSYINCATWVRFPYPICLKEAKELLKLGAVAVKVEREIKITLVE